MFLGKSGRGVAALVAATLGVLSVAPRVHAHSAGTPIDSGSRQGLTFSACPVGGVVEFTDSWGDQRSGGRRHEGVDMAADRGTPVIAVRGGDAEFKRSNLGGNAIWLITPAGDRFYYAHLDAWEGSSRAVSAGEVIGYVGSSGNARGNHLHFEWRPGSEAANPYSLVKSACAAGSGRKSPDSVNRL